MASEQPQKSGPFERGVAALRSGDRGRARDLLMEAVRDNPRDARAWLWLAGALDDPARQRECLQRALTLDPSNAAARQGLVAISQGSGARGRQPSARQRPATPGSRSLHPGLALLLSALGGVSAVFAGLAWRKLGAEVGPGALLVLALLAGVPLGLATLMMGGVLLRIAGRQLGGRGGSVAVRSGLAWAALPQIIGLPIWLGQLALLYPASFAGGRAIAASICWGVHWLLGFASLVLAVAGVAWAHRISIERAIGAWLLAALIVVGALAFIFSSSAALIALRGG